MKCVLFILNFPFPTHGSWADKSQRMARFEDTKKVKKEKKKSGLNWRQGKGRQDGKWSIWNELNERMGFYELLVERQMKVFDTCKCWDSRAKALSRGKVYNSH